MSSKASPKAPKHPAWDEFVELMPPAKSWTSAKQYLSTTAVLSVLNNMAFSPDYGEDGLYLCLKEAGYIQHRPTGSDTFFWLMA